MTWKIKDLEIKNRIVFAPMAGVSNISYRQIIKEMGAGLIYSEMISTLGIKYNGKKTIDLINFEETERPISIQIFGSDIESFVKAAKYIEENFHPDIIDINMGCPVPKVAIKSQAGSALLKDPDKIYEIVKNVVENTNTPITVKIRSGWDEKNINAVEVAKKIEKAGASAVAIHARTRSQGYSGKANWDIIKEVKASVNIPVIGNGDITTIYEAEKMLKETKCDAIMIGRATLGNPWFIKECVEYIENGKIINKPTDKEKIDMILHHYNLLKKYTNERTALLEIRTHALWYLKGIPGTKEIKTKICQAKTEEEFLKIINSIYEIIK
ncbi:MAG: tRNA dihydrouridine synthase DusB [Tenericutes bacterium]|nr:tRNA dihydrouridine synthase DusB [Mycoplasmatota bacterium]